MTKPKNFAQCYLYGLTNAEGDVVEKNLFEFLMTSQRINVNDQSFSPILNELKSRANNAVAIRMLQQGNVVLAMSKKEVPASFKIIAAKDPRDNRREKIFVDVTGLVTYQNGFFVCREIDRLATYMLGVLIYQIYISNPDKLIRNGGIQKYSVSGFVKMFAAELDYLRLTSFMSNRARISYIAGVYFAVNVMGLELASAKRVALSVTSSISTFSAQDAKNADFYYDVDDFKNINTFITSLANTFKLTGLTTDVFVDRWIYLYGKGTHFALELYPVFLNTVIYAYSGSYINNMKRIESVLGRDLLDLTNAVLKIGNDMFSAGFRYESSIDRDIYANKVQTFKEENSEPDDVPITNEDIKKEKENNNNPVTNTNNTPVNNADTNNNNTPVKEGTDELDAPEIHKDAIEEEPDNDGEVKHLVDELDRDSVLEADELDAAEISKEGLKSKEEDQSPKTPEEMDSLINQLENDTPLE